MPNLYFLNDHGAVMYDDETGQAYTKIGTRNDVLPNASFGPNDVGNITGYTFNTADAQGRTVIPAAEMAVGENLYFFQGLSTGIVNWVEIIASIPVSGVMRINGDNTGGGGQNWFRINGGAQVAFNTASSSGVYPAVRDIATTPYNVAAGDSLEIMSGHGNNPYTVRASIIIIPFVWPQP